MHRVIFAADLSEKSCTRCKEPLKDGTALAWEYGDWYHERCLLKAKRELADAMALARINYVIACYKAT